MYGVHECHSPTSAATLLKNKHLVFALFDRLTATTHVFNMKGCVSLRPRLNEAGESDAA